MMQTSNRQTKLEAGDWVQTKLQYTSSIKDMAFMFLEMRKTALLLCEGKSPDEILRLSIEENIYQMEKEKRRRAVPQRMTNRLATINKSLVEILAKGSADDAKLVALLALVKVDRLLFEYLIEVVVDKFEMGFSIISNRDFEEFIDRKAQNSDVVAKWSVDTLKSIRGKTKSILCEAGLAKRIKGGLQIQLPLASRELYILLQEHDVIYAKALLMEVTV